jgi:hypothetical protein
LRIGLAFLTNGVDAIRSYSYFRLRLTQEKLLTGNDTADATFVYVRANNTPLIVDTAQAFAKGMLPGATLSINTTSSSDPLFDPLDVSFLDRTDTARGLRPISAQRGETRRLCDREHLWAGRTDEVQRLGRHTL